jgi:hypothetical protein
MPQTEAKLTRQQFNERFRFRDCREQALVNCASCVYVTGETEKTYKTVSKCGSPLRFRPVKITREGWEDNGAKERVCDAYKNKPLPSDVVPVEFKEGEGAVLTTQFADCLHVDAKCPYVVEEQRLAKSGGRAKYDRIGEVRIVDVTENVPGETHQDACDMPCCESRLQFQIWDPNTYRNRVGIHPNAHDPTRFVRNGIRRHEKKANMTYEEAEAFFGGVAKVASATAGEGACNQISAVSDYIHKQVNRLGSKPLTEAVNPVSLNAFDLLAVPRWLDGFGQMLEDSANTGADVWMYDERLFDARKGLGKPLVQLEKIPEGIIPCMDTKRVLWNVIRAPRSNRLSESFSLYGILKPLEDKVLLSKGLSHFLDIRHVYYHSHEHWWGESGVGFSNTASFHEQ